MHVDGFLKPLRLGSKSMGRWTVRQATSGSTVEVAVGEWKERVEFAK